MSAKRHPDAERFVCIGDYSPPEAERFLDALQRAHIGFEIECDDGIRRCGGKFGRFGQEAKIRIWVDPFEMKPVEAIQADLFGTFSP